MIVSLETILYATLDYLYSLAITGVGIYPVRELRNPRSSAIMPTATEYTPTYHTTTYPFIDPTHPRLSTAGKTILITGSGSGIGAGIARSFARSGAQNVILLDLNPSTVASAKAALERDFPRSQIYCFAADITDAAAVERVFTTITSSIASAVEILVNNAGYLTTPGALRTADLHDWWRSFEVNVLGVAIVTRAFLNHGSSTRTTKRVVINLNSSVAHAGIYPEHSAYVASKMAALRMMESFQAENPAVRFVSINPGGVGTDMYRRFGMPEDFQMTDISLSSDAAVWLASDEADFLAGRMYWVAWDAEELMRQKEQILEEDQLRTGLKGIDGSLY